MAEGMCAASMRGAASTLLSSSRSMRGVVVQFHATKRLVNAEPFRTIVKAATESGRPGSSGTRYVGGKRVCPQPNRFRFSSLQKKCTIRLPPLQGEAEEGSHFFVRHRQRSTLNQFCLLTGKRSIVVWMHYTCQEVALRDYYQEPELMRNASSIALLEMY